MSNEQNQIRMETYSEKSFCVRGATKPIKEKMKDLGGRWNPNLVGGPGWIFRNTDREMVETYLRDLATMVEEDTEPCEIVVTPVVRKRHREEKKHDELRRTKQKISQLENQVRDLEREVDNKPGVCRNIFEGIAITAGAMVILIGVGLFIMSRGEWPN